MASSVSQQRDSSPSNNNLTPQSIPTSTSTSHDPIPDISQLSIPSDNNTPHPSALGLTPAPHPSVSSPSEPIHDTSPPRRSPLSSRSPSPSPSPTLPTIESDLPLLRRTHTTTGYRAGVSDGKDNPGTAQLGFDAGYPVGAELGMRVGVVLGGLRGLGGVLRRGNERSGGGASEGNVEMDFKGMLDVAEKEMSLDALLRERESQTIGHEQSQSRQETEKTHEITTATNSAILEKWERILGDLGKRYGIDLNITIHTGGRPDVKREEGTS